MREMSRIPAKFEPIRDDLCSALDKVIMEDQFLEEIRKVKALFSEQIWSQNFSEALQILIKLDIIRQASNK